MNFATSHYSSSWHKNDSNVSLTDAKKVDQHCRSKGYTQLPHRISEFKAQGASTCVQISWTIW